MSEVLAFPPGSDVSFLYHVFPWAHPGKFETDEHTTWFVLAQDGEILGAAGAQWRGPGVWYFLGGATDPDHRRQGIWKRLHKARTDYVIERYAKVLLAVSSRMNRQAFIDEEWVPMTTYPYHEDFDEVVFFKVVS